MGLTASLFFARISAVAFGLAGCASQPAGQVYAPQAAALSPEMRAEFAALDGNECIRNSEILSGFSALSDSAFFIDAGAGADGYLVRVVNTCFDGTFGQTIRLRGAGFSTCRGDRLDIGRSSCTIREIYRVDSADQARALQSFLEQDRR